MTRLNAIAQAPLAIIPLAVGICGVCFNLVVSGNLSDRNPKRLQVGDAVASQ